LNRLTVRHEDCPLVGFGVVGGGCVAAARAVTVFREDPACIGIGLDVVGGHVGINAVAIVAGAMWRAHLKRRVPRLKFAVSIVACGEDSAANRDFDHVRPELVGSTGCPTGVSPHGHGCTCGVGEDHAIGLA